MHRLWGRLHLSGFATLIALSLVGCSNSYSLILVAPTFSPASGNYGQTQMVTISDAVPNVAIYYTVDGSTPTAQSALFSSPISVSTTETIKAIAVGVSSDSAVATASYTITPLATPVFSPPPGTYTTAQTVAISDATPGTSIYYTVDGTTPTAASQLYTGPIAVASTETIEAIAVAIGYTNSTVAIGVYTISLTPPIEPGQWTWMNGSNVILSLGSYATLGVSSAGTTPGARLSNSTWTDNNGNLWVFGGEGEDSKGGFGYLNDLWSYNIATGQWTWVAGSNIINAYGVYGTLGITSAGDAPGARALSANWTDTSGNLWLYGGEGNDATTGPGALDDLWMFNPSTSLWTWEGGNYNSLNTKGTYGTLGIPSAGNLPGARGYAVSSTDNSGNFWLFGGNGFDASGTVSSVLNDLWQFNPNTKQWTWVSGSNTVKATGVYGTEGTPSSANVPGARGGSVGWVDSQGNFWMFSGYTGADISSPLNDLWMFNPNTTQWTWVSGSKVVEAIGTYGTRGFAAAGNTPGARYGGTAWKDSKDDLYYFGGSGPSSTNSSIEGAFNDLWMFNTTTKLWTWITGSNVPSVPGVYGTKGVSAPSNIPGARVFTSSWADKSGGYWLFGGKSEVSNGSAETNDLWFYVP